MKVVFVNPTGVLGGAERSLLDILSTVDRKDAECSLVLCGAGPLAAEAEKLGIAVQVLELGAELEALGDFGVSDGGHWAGASRVTLRAARLLPALTRFLRALGGALRSAAPDIVHSNGIKAHLLCALSRPPSARLVWHLRDFLGARPVVRGPLRLGSRRAALALANSNAVAEDARRVLSGLPVRTVYNSVDTARFSPGPAREDLLDMLANLPPPAKSTLRIGIVGTYARWKGHDLFLRAAASLLDTPGLPPCRFYIVGGPLYATAGSQYSEEELRAIAKRLRISSHVGLVPFQTDPSDVYRALDIVVQASTRPEPFGRTIVEAMACGRALVVAKAGGATELFEDGVDAIGFEPGSVDGLSTALERLMQDGDRRRELGMHGAARVRAHFSRERLRSALLRAWHDCVAAHP